MKNIEFFGTRHSLKGNDSQQYSGLSEAGVELAMQRTREDILKMIEQAPNGSVVFIGGASDSVRTKSTAEIYGNELAELSSDKEHKLKVITREEIFQIAESGKGYNKIVDSIKNIINANPDKKMVVDFPLFLKEFSVDSDWSKDDGSNTEYLQKILEKNNWDDVEAIKEWVSGEGKIDDITGPNPTEVAKKLLTGLKRLQEFAEKQIPERPLVIGFVGHAYNMDALTVYLANNGKVDLEGLNKLGNTMITETEMARLKIENGQAKLFYRGLEFDIDKSKL